ncbi:DNA topoisomerase IV subunit A [Pseudogracilibacillus auburnensis]|uniref:DNA topoisomerase 4 subunit A n=1 Tax=Pseudogracilibacillus auburnensis TaxID=1494959 RepID=A0A2V3VTZ3_9BACI|nr:DNA topoisomerase IV subunit A [Pseudogracilibacillus auburnensis]MBO1004593.1 DNA topoisomerase IV subunit A [Pseudogracilibacillus auburnensis]PXW85146.1 DNA topoisomerase IV subunit A [Pseudogracilibacillus auburnensis]
MAQAKQYVDLPLEEVIGDRFGRYSKYIIQDRALPDVRDGLKPVQRRILYAMHVDKNTHDKNFRKAAKTVGTVIGNYHPHGDTSVYDAMVRLSQSWKMRYELIEMHGNNGSIDGDPAAAMRYTEARLSKITTELMQDIEKETVDFIPNFDDTNMEPIVFPAKLPNLLINGSTGISAGYATNIPPHNLAEVIDAVILKMDKPNASVEDLMTKMKGPDFPTGGIVQGKDGIKQAFKTGKGRVVVRGNAMIEKVKGNREQIVIDEIPFDVNKANLVRKMDELAADRKVEGIAEVRDETDRTGLRIVIDLKKDANSEGVLNYLYKNTDLQVIFHYNMIAIEDKTPKLLPLPNVLDAYIDHQKEVVTRQTTFDLKKAKERAHIVDGLIKAISILDELIQTIRQSKNKADAKANIISTYEFSDAQAEAILALQLYRLTNTDITLLTNEKSELETQIESFEAILASPKLLVNVIKKELRRIKKAYASSRKTTIEKEIEEIKINIEVTVPNERVLVSVTKEGYIKRTSLRSFSASNKEDLLIKSSDHLIRLLEVDTTDHLLLFTNFGKYICVPVHELPDIRWKDMGNHLSNLTTLETNEQIVQCIPVRAFSPDKFLLFFTKQGMVKKSAMSLYQSARYSRSLIALNLRENDEVINVEETDGKKDVFLTTHLGYGLWFNESEISTVGQRAQGVIGIQLKGSDYVVSGYSFDKEINPNLIVVTQRGACKRMNIDAFEKSSRARRGSVMLRELKTKPHRIVGFFMQQKEENILLVTNQEKKIEMNPYALPISDRYSNGSFIIDADLDEEVKDAETEVAYEVPFEKEEN